MATAVAPRKVSDLNPANLLTIIRIVATPLVVWLILEAHIFSALCLYIFLCITDWLDGHVARRYGYGSVLGQILDPIADKVLTLTLIGTVYWMGQMWSFGLLTHVLTAFIFFREGVVTAVRVGPSIRVYLKAREGAIFSQDPLPVSPFGKLKTATQMVSLGLLMIAGYPLFEDLLGPIIWEMGERDLLHLGGELYLIAGAFTIMSGLDHLMSFRLSRGISGAASLFATVVGFCRRK